MYRLKTHEKDEALQSAVEKAEVNGHWFKPKISGPGGLRMTSCTHCGRSLYANHHGVTFGSAAREECDAT